MLNWFFGESQKIKCVGGSTIAIIESRLLDNPQFVGCVW